jgi:hypothetical protein
MCGPARGRAFEEAFYALCRHSGVALAERAGSCTLRHARSASGFRHESDAVVACADLTVHIELKHLTCEVGKSDLMVFNQKGLDFLASPDLGLRRRPLYRMFVSGRPVSSQARSFALLWGVVLVEPNRLPLLLLHWLLGTDLVPSQALVYGAERGWLDIPQLIVPLQDRVRRLSACLDEDAEIVSDARRQRVLNELQLGDGDQWWSALDDLDPAWLDDIYDRIAIPARSPLAPEGKR